MVYMPKTWRHSRGMMSIQRVWYACRGHGGYAKGMMAIPKTDNMLRHEWKGEGMVAQPKVSWPCKRNDGYAKGMTVMQMAWRSFKQDNKGTGAMLKEGWPNWPY